MEQMGIGCRLVAICLWLVAASQTAPLCAQDFKTAKQIMKNAAAAVGLEEGYKDLSDEIKDNRAKQLKWVNFRLSLRSLDKIERTVLKNFGRENRMYKRALMQVDRLTENAGRLLDAAQKNPENMAYFQENIGAVVATATEVFNNMVRLAMNSKVKTLGSNASPSTGSKGSDDGLNLLTQVERIELMEECIGELRAINRALTSVIFRLETKVSWAYGLRRVQPDLFYRTPALKMAFEDTLHELKDFDPF